MKPEQAGSYSTPHLTGVKRGGVCALQGSAKQLRLIDRANMRGQNCGRVGEGREGRAAAVLAPCPAYLAKAPPSLARWQMAGGILAQRCAGTQLAERATLEVLLSGGQRESGGKSVAGSHGARLDARAAAEDAVSGGEL